MSRPQDASSNATGEDREARLQALRDRLRPLVERAVARMADALTDLPDDQIFDASERTLRDQAHDLSAEVHDAAVRGRKKGLPRRQPRLSPLPGRRPLPRLPRANPRHPHRGRDLQPSLLPPPILRTGPLPAGRPTRPGRFATESHRAAAARPGR